MLQLKINSGTMDPIIGNMLSAYHHYNNKAQVTRGSEFMRQVREETMPLFTNYTRNFHGTIDHIFYTNKSLELTHLLQMPDISEVERDGTLPSTKYPSDHVRIEAKFHIK